MKRIGGYEYPLLSAEQVAPPESMIYGNDTSTSGGIYTLDEHSRNVGWCRGMSEFTDYFSSVDPAWNVSELASSAVVNGKWVTKPVAGWVSNKGAFIDIPPIYKDFEISCSFSWAIGASNPISSYFLMLFPDGGGFIAYAGVGDGWENRLGAWEASVVGGTSYYTQYGTVPMPGEVVVKITRYNGLMKVYLDGVERASGTSTTPITRIKLVNYKYGDSSSYGYADVTWHYLTVKRRR